MGHEWRLPGYGGAGLFLRCHVVPARTFESEAPSLSFDVGLLGPDQFSWYLNRPCAEGFVERLSEFLFRAAADFHPEQSLPTFTDSKMGMIISARASTDQRVEFDVELVGESGSDEMNFETSRVVLTETAHTLPRLTGDSATHFDWEL